MRSIGRVLSPQWTYCFPPVDVFDLPNQPFAGFPTAKIRVEPGAVNDVLTLEDGLTG